MLYSSTPYSAQQYSLGVPMRAELGFVLIKLWGDFWLAYREVIPEAPLFSKRREAKACSLRFEADRMDQNETKDM